MNLLIDNYGTDKKVIELRSILFISNLTTEITDRMSPAFSQSNIVFRISDDLICWDFYG
jgi:hypothetical protein